MRAQFEDAKEDLEASGIIEHGVALPVPFTSKGDSPTPRPTKLPEYYDYLALVPSPNSELGQRRAYDLIHNPEDICIKIAGGKMWYLGVVRSNVVRISKDMLVKALAKAGIM